MTREEALDFFNTYYPPTGWKDAWSARECAIEALEERKTGKWIKKSNISPFYTVWWYECSECGQYPLKDVYNQESLTNYCPNCGAKMEVQ